MIPVFDGHNDLLLRLHTNPGKREVIWSGAEGGGHLDLPRMRAGGFAGGFFAVYVVVFFIFMASPTATHAITKAALLVGVEPWLKKGPRK